MPVSDLAGTADGFHLCTDLVDLVERGKSKITATADPARPHALAVRLSARGGLEFRVFYVEPQQIADDSGGDDKARPAVFEGDARTHTAPLQPPLKVPPGEPGHCPTPDASAASEEVAAQPASSEGGEPSDSTAPHSRADALEEEGSQAQARDDAVPLPPCPPPTEAEAPTEQPGTSGELFKPKNATVLALRDAKDTRLAHKILRAAKAGV